MEKPIITTEIPSALMRSEYAKRWPESVPTEDQIDGIMHVMEVLTPEPQPLASEVAPGKYCAFCGGENHTSQNHQKVPGPQAPPKWCEYCHGHYVNDFLIHEAGCNRAAPTEPQGVEAPEDKHEREMLEVIDERDKWEERLGDLAVVAGCKEEWSNLHEHGDCIEEEILSLREQLEQANQRAENWKANYESENSDKKFWQSKAAAPRPQEPSGDMARRIASNILLCWDVGLEINGKFSNSATEDELTQTITTALKSIAGPQEPRCPRCKSGTSLVLRDYEDGWRLVCGANCGLIIGPNIATGLEFNLSDFAQFFFPAQSQGAAPHKVYFGICPECKGTMSGNSLENRVCVSCGATTSCTEGDKNASKNPA